MSKSLKAGWAIKVAPHLVGKKIVAVMAVVDEKLGFVPSGKSAPKFLL